MEVIYPFYLASLDCVEKSCFCTFAAMSFGNNDIWAEEDMVVAFWVLSNEDDKYNDNNENTQSASLFISPCELIRLKELSCSGFPW